MPFTLTLHASGTVLEVNEHETLLEAAHRQGVALPYSCKNGACGSCKGRILQGQVAQGPHAASALSRDEKEQGLALFCCAKAQSDLIVDIAELDPNTPRVQRFPCRVIELEPTSAPDVRIVKLQRPVQDPIKDRLVYRAGQYIEFLLKDGKRRGYSIATPPHHTGPMELHIRHMPGGTFTDHVFSTMQTRELLRCEGPLGTFYLREDNDCPLLFLASGTGFAPIKAIVEHAILMKDPRPMTLYWGARKKEDLYLLDLALAWAEQLPNFTFIPVLSEPEPNTWSGRIGFVHRALAEDYPDLSAHHVYACGAPVMVEAALRDFVAHHQLPRTSFFADAFITAAELAHPEP